MSEPRETAVARRGLVLILSSPSGAGKTTIARNLREQAPELELSISVTTRGRRPSEIDGTHYHFISRERFIKMRDGGELLEWAEVHGNFYATPREPVEQALAAGRDMLFDIDWQGTLQVYEAMRPDVVSVFILPPSVAELRSRLERRAEDSPEVIARRLANARVEIAHWKEYDYVIVNSDLEESVRRVRAILNAERARRERQTGMTGFADGLIAEL
ncbi:MAG: guanylate kinase [Flavobacteriaceae bacterium]